MTKKLEIKQIRSVIGRLENQKRTIKALGLGKMNRIVIHVDQPAIRGMINTVKHLVTVQEINGD